MTVLALTLQDGRPATLSLRRDSTCLAVDEVQVSSWDLGGRPYALVREGLTWRRALDGRLLQKGDGEGGPRLRALLGAGEGAAVVEAARADAALAREALSSLRHPARDRARARLGRVLAMGAGALARDAAAFARVYRPVGLLPPDQYLAVVVQATLGCSWNGCTFCDGWRQVGFHARGPAEFETHLRAVRRYFGRALALRRSVFLGSANALCAAPGRIDLWMGEVARAFRLAPSEARGRELAAWMAAHPDGMSGVSAFLDAWTGHRHGAAAWRRWAQLGLRRVYVGLETGDAPLLRWLGKAGTPDDAVALVQTLHEGGIDAGVIVLLGAGGEPAFATHAGATAAALSRMGLGPGDLVYFSDLVTHPGLEYEERAAASRRTPLGPERLRAQEELIRAGLRPADPARPPRLSRYDIREFVY